MTISISALLPFSVGGIIISGFYYFFATDISTPAALRLKYSLMVNKCSKNDTLFQQKKQENVALWFQSHNCFVKIPLYEETAWLHAKVNDKVKIEIETNQSYVAIDSSYACVVKAKHKYFGGWKTVGHVPRETSSYIYYLIKKGGRISGNMKSLNYKSLLIPPGGL